MKFPSNPCRMTKPYKSITFNTSTVVNVDEYIAWIKMLPCAAAPTTPAKIWDATVARWNHTTASQVLLHLEKLVLGFHYQIPCYGRSLWKVREVLSGFLSVPLGHLLHFDVVLLAVPLINNLKCNNVPFLFFSVDFFYSRPVAFVFVHIDTTMRM